MATGQIIPIKNCGVNGAVSGSAGTSISLNSSSPISRHRIAVVWVYSTSVTFSAVPSGWTTLFNAVIGNFRCGVFVHPNWDINSTANSVWTLSASAIWSVNSNSWWGIDATTSPLLITPVTSSGGSSTSLSAASVSTTDRTAYLGLWFCAAYYSSGATSATLSNPTNLVGAGIVSPSASASIVARCSAWSSASGENNPVLRAPTAPGAQAFPASPACTAWAAINLAVKAAEMPGWYS